VSSFITAAQALGLIAADSAAAAVIEGCCVGGVLAA
jgi:hypothetical protein